MIPFYHYIHGSGVSLPAQPECSPANVGRDLVRLDAPGLTILLPPPAFGDSILPVGKFDNYVAMDGTRYTYADNNQEWKLLMSFEVTREKSLELEIFLEYHLSSVITLTTQRGERYLGNILNNPFETVAIGRGEVTEFSLEFEGEKLTS